MRHGQQMLHSQSHVHFCFLLVWFCWMTLAGSGAHLLIRHSGPDTSLILLWFTSYDCMIVYISWLIFGRGTRERFPGSLSISAPVTLALNILHSGGLVVGWDGYPVPTLGGWETKRGAECSSPRSIYTVLGKLSAWKLTPQHPTNKRCDKNWNPRTLPNNK